MFAIQNGVVMATPEQQTKPEYLTAEEVAAIARVHVNTVYDAIRLGELRAGGTRQRYRIRPEWVTAWLERGR